VNEWRTREKATIPMNLSAIVNLQTDYIHDILALLNTHDENQSMPKFDFNKSDILLKEYLQARSTDIVHYRDVSFEPVVDTKDKRIVEVLKPWIENMDDSMENLLSNYRT
jgi:hypothetical protein